MWLYAARRILYAVPIAIGVTMICFCLVFLAPGDPVQMLLPPDASQQDIEYLKKLYGFDQPIPIQYCKWLVRATSGDLGVSLQTSRPVFDEGFRALSNTVIIVFAVELGVLPATGMASKGSDDFSLRSWAQFKYAILPIITMSMVPLGIIMRSTRSAVAEVLAHDFVATLRAKGLREFAVLRHAVRNALPQILAVMGLQFGYLVGGSILIETIFTWPGTGFLLSKAILTRDIPVLQGAILVLALCFVATNLAVDLIQTSVDPRIKRA